MKQPVERRVPSWRQKEETQPQAIVAPTCNQNLKSAEACCILLPEIFMKICQYISIHALHLTCAKTCRLWHLYICRDYFPAHFYKKLWRNSVAADYPHQFQVFQSKKKILLGNDKVNKEKDWRELYLSYERTKKHYARYFPLAIEQHCAQPRFVYIPSKIMSCKHSITFRSFAHAVRKNSSCNYTVMECKKCTAVVLIPRGKSISLKNPEAEILKWSKSVHNPSELEFTCVGPLRHMGGAVEYAATCNEKLDPYLLAKGPNFIDFDLYYC